MLLSTPVVAGVVSLVLAFMFRTEIRSLSARIAHIRLPGGGELTTTQQERNQVDIAPSTKAPQLPAGDVRVELPAASANGIDPKDERIQQLIRSERATAILWEYRFLNFYLARITQLVLGNLAERPPISVRQLDAELMAAARDPVERKAILDALTTHHLVTTAGDLIEITPKGREYLQWRGPLPAAKEPPALPDSSPSQ